MSEGDYQSIGNKGIHRTYLSVKVLEVAEIQKNLFKAIRLGVNQNRAASLYSDFVAEFYGLYQTTWMFTKDVHLAVSIDDFFGAKNALIFNPGDISVTNVLFDLFKKYLVSLKDSGIYDPAIFHKTDGGPAWVKSI